MTTLHHGGTTVRLILGLHPANERRSYKVTPFLIDCRKTRIRPEASSDFKHTVYRTSFTMAHLQRRGHSDSDWNTILVLIESEHLNTCYVNLSHELDCPSSQFPWRGQVPVISVLHLSTASLCDAWVVYWSWQPMWYQHRPSAPGNPLNLCKARLILSNITIKFHFFLSFIDTEFAQVFEKLPPERSGHF